MPYHEIWLTNDSGVRLTLLSDNLGGYFGRITNGIGPCKLTMPATFDWKSLNRDYMIQFWRQPTGGRFGLWRTYFLRYWNPRYQDGELVIDLEGVDEVDLLRRRVVAAFSGSANATATAEESDDLMKRLATDMLSDVIAPTPDEGTRAWSSFSVQGDLTLGPTLTESFEWRNVLDLFEDLAEASLAAGTEIFFTVDSVINAVNTITFEFRTTIGQPGQDRTAFVVFDADNRTLISPSLEYDYRDEVNYIYGLGQGEGADQNIQQVANAVRYGASKWNRCEGTAYAGGEETDNGVMSQARVAREKGRPRRTFSGKLVDSPGLRFGVDWNWGDKVRARAFGLEFDAIARKVFVRIDRDQQESIDSILEYETA